MIFIYSRSEIAVQHKESLEAADKKRRSKGSKRQLLSH